MPKTESTYNLIWFTNNLRSQDNHVLKSALHHGKPVIAVYCFDPRLYAQTEYGFKKTERYRAKFTIESIIDLKRNLHTLNIPLLVYHDIPESAILELTRKHYIQNIFVQKEFTSEETTVINALKQNISEAIQVHELFDQFLYDPKEVNHLFKDIPNIFTAFRKQIEKHVSISPSILIRPQHAFDFKNDTQIPTLEYLGFLNFECHNNSAFPFQGGESSALQRLNDYVFETKKIGVYKKTRNGLVGIDYSSKLSAWLANGCISARTIYWAIKDFETQHFKNESTYWLIFELIWRDFFKFIAMQHGNSIFKITGILNKSYEWHRDTVLINKWISGTTSEPFVNANMIELKETGWMSNRGRQNVASYFAKGLMLDWRIGAAYFESLLIDYDIHSNYGNWLYVAGVGNDPRDRVFNVKLQAERYDPKGLFQKRWLQTRLFA